MLQLEAQIYGKDCTCHYWARLACILKHHQRDDLSADRKLHSACVSDRTHASGGDTQVAKQARCANTTTTGSKK